MIGADALKDDEIIAAGESISTFDVDVDGTTKSVVVVSATVIVASEAAAR